MSVSKTNKLFKFVNWKMRVTIQDGRQFVGQFIAFDRHTNIVMKDCVEFRRENDENDTWSRRDLGLILLRGQHVVVIQPEAPPQPKKKQLNISMPGVSSTVQQPARLIPVSNVAPGLIPIQRPMPGRPPMGMRPPGR
jgi:small nuclear ribonucleoprotein B and B'